MTRPAIALAALAALAALPAAAPTAAAQETSCAASPTGFVDGAPCFSLRGRMFNDCNPTLGCGIEADMLRGTIGSDNVAERSLPLSKLAAPLVPIRIVASPARQESSLNFNMGDPEIGSLAIFRTPATFPEDLSREVRIRTNGTGNVVARFRSLTDAGGSPVRWRDIGANRWYLALFDADWRLLD